MKLNLKELSDNDIVTYLEAARTALADADFFDDLATALDISDSEMIRLRDQLTEFLGA